MPRQCQNQILNWEQNLKINQTQTCLIFFVRVNNVQRDNFAYRVTNHADMIIIDKSSYSFTNMNKVNQATWY